MDMLRIFVNCVNQYLVFKINNIWLAIIRKHYREKNIYNFSLKIFFNYIKRHETKINTLFVSKVWIKKLPTVGVKVSAWNHVWPIFGKEVLIKILEYFTINYLKNKSNNFLRDSKQNEQEKWAPIDSTQWVTNEFV